MASIDQILSQEPWASFPVLDRSQDPWGFLKGEKLERWSTDNPPEMFDWMERRDFEIRGWVRFSPKLMPERLRGTTREALWLLRQIHRLGWVGGETLDSAWSIAEDRHRHVLCRAAGWLPTPKMMGVRGTFKFNLKTFKELESLEWVHLMEAEYPFPTYLPSPDEALYETVSFERGISAMTECVRDGGQVYPAESTYPSYSMMYCVRSSGTQAFRVELPSTRLDTFMSVLRKPGFQGVDPEVLLAMAWSRNGWYTLCRGYSYWET